MADDRTIEEIRAQKLQDLKNQSNQDNIDPTPDAPIQVESPEQFTSIVEDYDVVLADFYADWCGPCQMLEPVIGGIARETDAAVAKVDVDDQQQLATEFGVRGVPTLVLFANGDAVEQLVGTQQFDQLAALIDNYSS